MANCNQTVPIGKDQLGFAKLETSCGVFEAPAGSDAIRFISDASFMQGMEFLNDEQKRLTLSMIDRIPGAFNPGAFNFTMYVKPSGALGTAPQGSDVLEAGFGTKTITPATSVEYTLAGIADAIKTLTIVFKRGHTTFFNIGCVVDKLKLPVEAGNSQTAIGQVQVDGMFLKQVKAGYTTVDNVAGYVALDTDITVHDAREIDAGSLIKFGAEDNGGAGYTVVSTGADLAIPTEVIVISPGLAGVISDDDPCDGMIQTATDSGVLVFGRYGTYTEEAVAIPIITAEVELVNNMKIIENEKTNTAYPTTIIRANNREVTVAIDQIFYRGNAKYYTVSRLGTEQAVVLNVGATASEKYQLNMPKCVYDPPELAGDEEVIETNKLKALGTASFDDEISLMFD